MVTHTTQITACHCFTQNQR